MRLSCALQSRFDRGAAAELLRRGGQEEALYRYLLLMQCHMLSVSLPFIFEKVSTLSALLLPESLLSADSVVSKLVRAVPEESWQAGVEILGWLFQFYIDDLKEKQSGRIAGGRALAAATQFFTPAWIAEYLVQSALETLPPR